TEFPFRIAIFSIPYRATYSEADKLYFRPTPCKFVQKMQTHTPIITPISARMPISKLGLTLLAPP
ncbi:MAG TPA: hypothetical protein PK299_13665, partial [Anaerolineales bacterium]|nr:hypothetical protein [Anaerolineales bacterium]